MRGFTQGRWTAVKVAAAVLATILLVHIAANLSSSAQPLAAGEAAALSQLTAFLSGARNGSQIWRRWAFLQRNSTQGSPAERVFLRLRGAEAAAAAAAAAGGDGLLDAAASGSLADDAQDLQEPERPPHLQAEGALEPDAGASKPARTGGHVLDLGTDPRLMVRLGRWRGMVQNLMDGRSALTGSAGAGSSRKEAIEVALLATSKPGSLVRRAAQGGKQGSFLPALMLTSLLRGARPASGGSWLDRTTDAFLDHLERPPGEQAPDATQPRPRKAWPADECAGALKVPKVAMLFLTRGEMHHTATWDLWFKYAQGWLPAAPVRAACAAGPDALEAARQACARRAWGTGEDVLGNQHLFSVYAHVGLNEAGFQGFRRDALWYRRDILERVRVEWGQHSLVTATRNLLRVALDDPLNARFIQLSEACVPLYPPTVLYHQLMSERKSRLNACAEPGWERHERRWTDAMATEHMTRGHWRKSSQWIGLTREHAQLVVADTDIDAAFLRHCYPTEEGGQTRDCFSDEHYFATLLAVLGRENETDCRGFLVNTDWMRGGAHPRTYELPDVSAARLRLLRMPMDKCGYQSAIQSGASQFVRLEELGAGAGAGVCSAEPVPYSRSLGPQCPLFARKFAPETAAAVTALLAECKHRLRIVHGLTCEQRLTQLRKYL